ncbi:MAG TPA: hypothetical protein VFI92_03150 [Steroidobacteraceae bacterium]|nr:hypothetical protein [Steroidobacteraceae bacterium]
MSGRGPSVRVALPWLHDAIGEARTAGTLPAMSALRWLAGRGNAAPPPQGGWREWLLGGVDATMLAEFRRWSAGSSLAAAAGAGVGSAPGWAVAQPVHLAAGLDDVRMAPLADAAPTPAEAEQLAATVRGHFAGDVFDLVDFVDGAWLVRCTEPIDCTTHDPATLAGRNIHDYLPAGRDGARMRSRMNEIQMVLHDHAVNERRTSTRAAPINALWLWGFGTFETSPQELAATRRWVVQSDDLWLRSYWRAHGGAERSLGAAGDGDALIAMTQLPTTEPGEALAEVDSSLLERLRRAVQAGEWHSLAMYDGARVYTLDRHARLRVWRRPAALGSD